MKDRLSSCQGAVHVSSAARDAEVPAVTGCAQHTPVDVSPEGVVADADQLGGFPDVEGGRGAHRQILFVGI